jgi:hypothetical protein
LVSKIFEKEEEKGQRKMKKKKERKKGNKQQHVRDNLSPSNKTNHHNINALFSKKWEGKLRGKTTDPKITWKNPTLMQTNALWSCRKEKQGENKMKEKTKKNK